jgi:hypothetical protein
VLPNTLTTDISFIGAPDGLTVVLDPAVAVFLPLDPQPAKTSVPAKATDTIRTLACMFFPLFRVPES